LLRAGLARLSDALPRSAEEMAAWRQRFDQAQADLEDEEVKLARDSAAFRQLRELAQATPHDVAKALPAGTAFLDFFQYNHRTPPPRGKWQWSAERRLLAFILVPGREPVCVRLGSADDIAKAVQSWRQAVTAYRPTEKAGGDLARLVWQPLRKYLTGIDTVLIVPDGVVCDLPFAALPGKAPGSFLLEELTIGYVTSGRHLLERDLDANSPRGRGLLAVGDLDFGPLDKAPPALPIFAPRSWAPLPGTRPEVEQLVGGFRKAFPDQTVQFLRGRDASAAVVKAQLPPAPTAARAPFGRGRGGSK
jgi:hypothetical protein